MQHARIRHGARPARDRQDRIECAPCRDEIRVKFLPARDGSPLGFVKTVSMPHGRVIQISAGNSND
jgi:hypothetical protein